MILLVIIAVEKESSGALTCLVSFRELFRRNRDFTLISISKRKYSPWIPFKWDKKITQKLFFLWKELYSLFSPGRQHCIVMHFLHNLTTTSCLHMWLSALSHSYAHTLWSRQDATYINVFHFLSNMHQNTLVDCYNRLLFCTYWQ